MKRKENANGRLITQVTGATGHITAASARRRILLSEHSTRPGSARGNLRRIGEGLAVERQDTVFFHHGRLMCVLCLTTLPLCLSLVSQVLTMTRPQLASPAHVNLLGMLGHPMLESKMLFSHPPRKHQVLCHSAHQAPPSSVL